jgi:hypothetical protein
VDINPGESGAASGDPVTAVRMWRSNCRPTIICPPSRPATSLAKVASGMRPAVCSACHGFIQGRTPCSSSAIILPVMQL